MGSSGARREMDGRRGGKDGISQIMFSLWTQCEISVPPINACPDTPSLITLGHPSGTKASLPSSCESSPTTHFARRGLTRAEPQPSARGCVCALGRSSHSGSLGHGPHLLRDSCQVDTALDWFRCKHIAPLLCQAKAWSRVDMSVLTC